MENSVQIIDKRASVVEMPINEVNTDVVKFNPAQLIHIAVQNKYDLDYVDKLMDLQEKWEKREAEKAFIAAMAEFKKNPPMIIKEMAVKYKTKTGGITSYNHASLGNVVYSIIEELSKYGLDSTWESHQDEKTKLITITNVIRHTMGHCQKYSLSAYPDYSGGKNEIHALRSTVTHLSRYTILDNTGLATNEHEINGELGHPNNPKTQSPRSNNQQTGHRPQRDKKEIPFDQTIKQALDLLEKIPLLQEDKQAWHDSIEGITSDKIANECLVAVKNLYATKLKELSDKIGKDLMDMQSNGTKEEKQASALKFLQDCGFKSRAEIKTIEQAQKVLKEIKSIQNEFYQARQEGSVQ